MISQEEFCTREREDGGDCSSLGMKLSECVMEETTRLTAQANKTKSIIDRDGRGQEQKGTNEDLLSSPCEAWS